jgi:hypothetical protein
LIAPDGTEFTSFLDSAERNTLAELATLAFGDWTAIEYFDDGQSLTYQLRVAPFPLLTAFPATPVVTSPSDGAVVPKTFDLDFHFPPGSIPNTTGVKSISGTGVSISFGSPSPPNCCHKQLTVSDRAIEVGSFTFWTFSQFGGDAPQIISAVPPDERFTLILRLRAYSEPVTVVPVPEPQSFGLAGIVLIAFAVVIRGGHRT